MYRRREGAQDKQLPQQNVEAPK